MSLSLTVIRFSSFCAAGCVLGWLAIACVTGCAAQDGAKPRADSKPSEAPQPNAGDNDVSRLLSYLAKTRPGEQWQVGPTRLDSPEVRRAYPDSRFYFVASPQALPRGARPPSKVPGGKTGGPEAKRVVSLCVRFGPQGDLTELRHPGDYNSGLVPLRSEEDVCFAAAAILSTLDGYYFAPSAISHVLVKVRGSQDGWICRLRTQTQEGRVVFSAEGRCIAVSMRYRGPFPG